MDEVRIDQCIRPISSVNRMHRSRAFQAIDLPHSGAYRLERFQKEE